MDTIKVRASSLPELFDCPARWKAKHLLGVHSATNARAHLGTAVHRATAAFDNERMAGRALSVDDASGVLVDVLNDKGAEVRWDPSDLGKRQAEAIGINLVSKYATKIGLKTEFEAVELKLPPIKVAVGGVIIELTGQADRIRIKRVQTEGAPDLVLRGLCDLKTGKNAVDSAGSAVSDVHGYQLATYELLDRMATPEGPDQKRLPPMVYGLQTSDSMRVAADEVPNTSHLLTGQPGEPGLLEMAATMYFKPGLYPGNPSSKLCSEKWCPAWAGCRFRASKPPEGYER